MADNDQDDVTFNNPDPGDSFNNDPDVRMPKNDQKSKGNDNDGGSTDRMKQGRWRTAEITSNSGNEDKGNEYVEHRPLGF